MAALISCILPLHSVFGNWSSSAINPRLVGNLPSSSAMNSRLKNVAIKCSNANNTSSDATPEVIQQHFHPSVWDGHDFTSRSTNDLAVDKMLADGEYNIPIFNSLYTWQAMNDERMLKELKKEVMLSLAAAGSFQELDLIDKIQRLGVAYHFKDRIEDILQRTYNDDYTHFCDQNIGKDEHLDLCYISLRFRLLRQAGYYVSTDVFKKFQDEKGEFHANLASDVQAMLSLREASYLSFSGEDILDEAMQFSTKHLNSMLTWLSSSLSLQVQHALQMPLQRSPERVYARYYMSIYQQDISRNETLLEFAKLDYNAVQLLHRKEINEVQMWWKRINIRSKLQFNVRDRVVEAYAITTCIFNFDPQFSLMRIHLAKLWSMLTVVDDAYDVFGKLEELGLLDDAFQRWDAKSTSELSNAMKVVFLQVLNFVNEIETDITGGRKNLVGISYLKKELQVHTKALLEEAKIIFSGNLPTFEEWLSVSIPTSGINPFFVVATMHLGELATKEVFEWIARRPKLIKYSYLLIRLLDDIASPKPEDGGTNVSSVLCYMMEHKVSESEAIESLQKVTGSLWKLINEECLGMHPVPKRILKDILNFNRTIELYYAGVDGHTVSTGRTKEIITSVFINPIPK